MMNALPGALVVVLVSAPIGPAQTSPPCTVWSNAENRCLDEKATPKPRPVDARLAIVTKAWVQPVDDLAFDRPVALCFAERLGRLTPVSAVKTLQEADVIFRITAHVADPVARGIADARRALGLPSDPSAPDLHSVATITAELRDATPLWTETYFDPKYDAGTDCALAEDLLTTLRDAMRKARDQK